VYLSSLNARDFRNFQELSIEPNPQFNILSGDNGQGKTNLLEAIFWLGTLRPIRSNRLRELNRWTTRACRVAGSVHLDGLNHRLAVEFKEGVRQAYREDKKARSNDFFGALSVVLFTPDDVGLIRGAPERRRRFLDRAIFTGRPSHLDDFVNYRRALDARNQLLRDQGANDLLDVYEQTLAIIANKLIRSRLDFVEQLRPQFSENLATILGSEYPCTLKYKSSINLKGDDGVEHLSATWAADRERDRERGFTQRGPHADDINFQILGHSARTYASQGQQRSMVLAMKIAEIQLLKERNNQVPVVLLDDVSSELDATRNERLFEFLNGFEGQVFITTTDPNFLRIDGDRSTWQVHNGIVSPRKD
jgi:DNA replication and repair protein RecF